MLHIGWKHENNPRQEGKLGKVVSWQQECKLAAAAGNYDFSLNVSVAQVGGGSTFKGPTITKIRVSKGFLCFEMYRLLSDMQWSIRGDQKTSLVSKINDYEWNVKRFWGWCLANHVKAFDLTHCNIKAFSNSGSDIAWGLDARPFRSRPRICRS